MHVGVWSSLKAEKQRVSYRSGGIALINGVLEVCAQLVKGNNLKKQQMTWAYFPPVNSRQNERHFIKVKWIPQWILWDWMGPSFVVVFSLLLVALLVHSCDHTVLAAQHRHSAWTFFFLLCIMRSVWIIAQPFVSFTCRFCFPPRGVWESMTVEFAFHFADLQNQSNGETSKKCNLFVLLPVVFSIIDGRHFLLIMPLSKMGTFFLEIKFEIDKL